MERLRGASLSPRAGCKFFLPGEKVNGGRFQAAALQSMHHTETTEVEGLTSVVCPDLSALPCLLRTGSFLRGHERLVAFVGVELHGWQ